MAVGSTAIAMPLFLNLADPVEEARAAAKRTGKKDKIYFITDKCIGCHACKVFCPQKAIFYGERKMVIDQTYDCCKRMDIPVLTETRAKKFVKDSSGKVTGVIAETKDGDIQVNFKACFIAAGGFGANYKKCQEVWPKIYNNIQQISTGSHPWISIS